MNRPEPEVVVTRKYRGIAAYYRARLREAGATLGWAALLVGLGWLCGASGAVGALWRALVGGN